jgi:uncharacterized membrane protein
MTINRARWSDQEVELIIGNLLRAGVLLSALVIVAGGIVFLLRHGAAHLDYTVFRGQPAELRSVGGILASAFSFRGRGMIQLGLLILIATPVARVAFSVAAFALEHDRLYVIVTLIVLAVLLFSFAGGHL